MHMEIFIPVEVSFVWNGIKLSSSIIEMMIHKNFERSERMEVLITSYVKVCLGNKYISYIYTARNAKGTSTRIVSEKTVMKRKKKGYQRRI